MEQLKLLMDYTIFHAGVYITLGGLMVALLGLKAFETRAAAMLPFLIAAFSCFLFAGFCAGIIASNIPYHTDFNEFRNAWIGPWIFPHITRAWFCMSAEHTAFWAGVFIFLIGFGITSVRRGDVAVQSSGGTTNGITPSAIEK